MDEIAKVYFQINFFGAVFMLFYSKTEDARGGMPDMLLDEYDEMSNHTKFILGTLTFLMNCATFLPMIIIKFFAARGE